MAWVVGGICTRMKTHSSLASRRDKPIMAIFDIVASNGVCWRTASAVLQRIVHWTYLHLQYFWGR